jgi:hypothetical protein
LDGDPSTGCADVAWPTNSWSTADAIPETRLLPAKTQRFIEFPHERLAQK